MAQEKKKSFVLYCDYRIHLQILTDAERGKLLMALMDYAETGKEPELQGGALMAFSFITMQMDKDAARYAETCRKRSEAGQKGGRPAKATETEEKQEQATKTPKKQRKAKKAKGLQGKQTKAKKPDNENDNDNEKNINIFHNTTPTPPSEGEKAPKGADAEAAETETEDPTPYKAIVGLYHDICVSFPKLRSVSNRRKTAMAARWKEYEGNLETFRELFTKAEASKFLKGESESGWSADFNWLMNSENMAKVLEGKYEKDKQQQSNPNSSFETRAFFESAVARSFDERANNPPKTGADDPELMRRGEELRARLG